jgi:hypothetical protein
LDSSIPSVAEADETTVTFRQAVLENELSQDIQLLLSTQSEFACPRMIVAPNMATGFQPWIVGPMLLRQARSRKSPEAAVAWLEKVLSTERAEGIEIETFWGFTPTAKGSLLRRYTTTGLLLPAPFQAERSSLRTTSRIYL